MVGARRVLDTLFITMDKARSLKARTGSVLSFKHVGPEEAAQNQPDKHLNLKFEAMRSLRGWPFKELEELLANLDSHWSIRRNIKKIMRCCVLYFKKPGLISAHMRQIERA